MAFSRLAFFSSFSLLKIRERKKKEKKKATWQPHIYRYSREVNIGEAKTINLRALASRDAKKKSYFIFSNTTLSILLTHFTTNHTFQFLFLHTTQ